VSAEPIEPFAVDRVGDERQRAGARRYTRGQILDAIRRWADEYGAPPTLQDWEPSSARRSGNHARADRFDAGDWPSARMVRRQFGSFGAAVRAAGFECGVERSTKPHLSAREEVLRAIREWTRRYGDPPLQADWDVARARKQGDHWRIERYRSGDWPSLVPTRWHFGSLSAAIRAAGLEAPARWEPLEERVQRQLRNAVVVLRGGDGTTGPAPLAQLVREVAKAREADVDDLRAALMRLAATALRWERALAWGATLPDEDA
jgi:hypothetical protein